MYSIVLLAILAGSPMTLPEIEAEALANNPDIQASTYQSRLAESRLGTAAAVEDPQFGYRAWSTPLLQPWNLNQTQHMFMLTQNIPGKGKRELKYLVASDDHMIPPAAQRQMAARAGARVAESPGSHALYVSHPGAVADLIRQAAAGAAQPAAINAGQPVPAE